MADRTTKVLLLAVALWMNVVGAWLRPAAVQAQGSAQAGLAFVDYWQLVEQQREQGVAVEDIQVLLLSHIAGNTR